MRPATYKHYVLGVLALILLCNYLDRTVLGIVLQSIKTDFDLSDTQLGVLTGIAFAVFYSIMGVPIARWADSGNRVTIISSACALWSGLVVLSGLASSFTQLLLIRVVIGVGEAGCLPPAFSLMADYFNRAERPRAVTFYGIGSTIAIVVGYFVGGWLNDHYGWRVTFMALGVPGVVVALLARFTLREPRLERLAAGPSGNSMRRDADSARQHQPTIAVVCTTLWSNLTFRRLLLCLVGMLFFDIGLGQWLPAFFIRSHGLTAAQVGASLAIVVGVSGLVGSFAGGALFSRYAANKESLQLRAMAIALICAGAAATFVFLTPNVHVALTLYGLHIFLMAAASTGPLFGTIQTVVPERMRAMAFALSYMVGNLIGAGFGPLTAGVLSDLYQPWAHQEALRYALVTLAPGYCIVALCAWRASASVARDLALADKEIEDSAAVPSMASDCNVSLPS